MTHTLVSSKIIMTKPTRLKALLNYWKHQVEFLVNNQYEGRFYRWDYLNDMDHRQLIEESLSKLEDAEKIEIVSELNKVDSKLIDITDSTDSCIWGEESAQENQWTPEKNWWYFRRPRNIAKGWGWDELP
jgi:hypothetical protein